VVHHRNVYDAVSASSAVNNSVGTIKEYQGTAENKHIKYIPKPLEHVFNSLDQLRHHSIDQFIPDAPVK
jgi:hypothetical protein